MFQDMASALLNIRAKALLAAEVSLLPLIYLLHQDIYLGINCTNYSYNTHCIKEQKEFHISVLRSFIVDGLWFSIGTFFFSLERYALL